MKFKIDLWLVLPALFLIALGLILLRSIAPVQLPYQIVFVGVAIVVFVVFSWVDYRIIFSLHLPIYILSLLFLVTPYFFGTYSRGALRWLQLGSVSLQPSEIVKPFLLITFAALATSSFSKRRLWLVLSFLITFLIIFSQHDLGTYLVLVVGWLTIFVSKVTLRLILVGSIIGLLVLLPTAWISLKSYQKDRLFTFVNPYSDPLGRGYHVIQSTLAVGSGQLWGRGLGHGPQSQLRFLPERHTDFIFASLSEELGFVGALMALVLFGLLLHRVYYISQITFDPPAFYFCLATLTLLSFQIFVNIGMNLGLAPVTGITLPFLSSGGSSLVSLAITLGILNSIRYNTHYNAGRNSNRDFSVSSFP